MPNLRPLIDSETISERIRSVASEIDRGFRGDELVIVMVLKGSFMLVADLMRELKTPTTLECVQASSYGQLGTLRGDLSVRGVESLSVEGKDLLVVDDIFDSGETLSGIVRPLEAKRPRSLRTLVLLEKRINRTHSFRPDYALFPIENEFVVGYGLDYKEHYRNLPGIFVLENG